MAPPATSAPNPNAPLLSTSPTLGNSPPGGAPIQQTGAGGHMFTPLTQDELAMLSSSSPAPGAARASSPSGARAASPIGTVPQHQQHQQQAQGQGQLQPPQHAAPPRQAQQQQQQQQNTIGGTMLAAALGPDSEIRTFRAGDTLDEPMRDLKAIWFKLQRVCFPRKGGDALLRDWDLWGPLLLCLALSIVLSISAPADQTAAVFTGIFVIVWVGAAVVTLNAKLLGGRLSFFQSVCVLGYCIFPLFIAALVALFFKWIVIRGPVVVAAFLWSTYASLAFLNAVNLANRRLLAIYPVYLFFFAIAWMVLISKPMV